MTHVRHIAAPRRFVYRSSRRWTAMALLVVGLVMGILVEAPWARAIFLTQTVLVGYVVWREWGGGRSLVVDDEGYRLEAGGRERFRVRWDEVKKVQSVPENGLVHVDTGTPERNLLLPPSTGWGFQYAGQSELRALILGRVADRVAEVRMPSREELDQQKAERAQKPTEEPPRA